MDITNFLQDEMRQQCFMRLWLETQIRVKGFASYVMQFTWPV